ncbi:nucleotide exchange factor GrpE [Brochothrix thermosphacta]|uniref:nucleotide exchange factor GrpE n=1 Tax=Brochothrix thermosphacta TaxID=2756 RepID=UPI00083F8B17|nr:nucleotide exchange factor GrpE [Brochothrix thermosphacta]ODJ69811.1 nucleotide exchange factor GrpE [Brochothrix thermosphacta]
MSEEIKKETVDETVDTTKETNETNETEETINESEAETSEEVVEPSELEVLTEKYDELETRYLRLQADFDNSRRRQKIESASAAKFRSQSLVEKLLPVLDNFERAMATELAGEDTKSFLEGIEIVQRQLEAAMEAEGVEVIATVGEKFDPNVHQAVMQDDDKAFDSNVVTAELQKGYKLKDRVIRPAMVKVNQ